MSSPLVLLISGLALVGVAALMRKWRPSQKPLPGIPRQEFSEDHEIMNQNPDSRRGC